MFKKIMIAAVATCLLSGVALAQTAGSFIDPRDNEAYRTVRIGNLTWMAENLNYQTKDSWCYDNTDSNCAKYGRLYTWDAAMTACPAGWRLPSYGDWDSLLTAVGNRASGIKLRSKKGWNTNKDRVPGTDEYGFSALPGGSRHPFSGFTLVGDYGSWWSATDRGVSSGRLFGPMVEDTSNAWARHTYYDSDYLDKTWAGKKNARSVRCVRE